MILLLCVVLRAYALPLYTDGSSATLTLVLCDNLHDAVLALKQREVLVLFAPLARAELREYRPLRAD